MINHLLSQIAKTFSKYDTADSLACLAGLQLIPENVDCTLRLEILTHLTASIINKGFAKQPKINEQQLLKICNSEYSKLEELVRLEDPFNNPFTEAFTFHGGSYIVFPGNVEHSTFILRHLSQAISLTSPKISNQTFINQAQEVILTILALSNSIAQKACLLRGMKAFSNPEGNIVIPKSENFEQLKKAVIFSWEELYNLLDVFGIDSIVLEKFTVRSGQISFDNYDIENGDLFVRPIVKCGNQFIVALPGMLITAARHELILLANRYNVEKELAQFYHNVVWKTVMNSMSYIDNKITNLALPFPCNIEYFQDAFFAFDTDKVAYVGLLTDSLEDYNYCNPFDRWEINKINNQLEQRIYSALNHIFTEVSNINDILLIFITQGIGRTLMHSFKSLPEIKPLLMLLLSASDLETIALLEGGQPLTLWKYACSSWRLSQRAKVFYFTELHKFAYYREKYSFYFSDVISPTCIGIEVDSSRMLRQKVVDKFDIHSVLSFDYGYYIDVVSLYQNTRIPIYMPKSLIDGDSKNCALYIEGLPLPMWVVGSKKNNKIKRELYSFYYKFTEAIAYWLWQFTPAISCYLKPLTSQYTIIIIHLILSDDENWYQIQNLETEVDNKLLNVVADLNSGTLNVTLSSAISSLLGEVDNRGERYLMQSILLGLGELLLDKTQKQLSKSIVREIIEHHAPLGLKKKILFLNLWSNPELDPDGLPRYRKVQEADVDELLEEIGEYLKSVEKIQKGLISDDNRIVILRKVVDFLYKKLVKLVASLKPEGLLENLVAHHEAIIHDIAQTQLFIPTRLACFSSEPEMIKTLNQEIPESHKAALASRFIIEYVVTQPPSGIRPFSYSIYDCLQAIASQIINFGFESDLIYFSLADLKLEMLPSGRLGVDREHYEKARDRYSLIFFGSEIIRATNNFSQYWKAPESLLEKPSLVVQLDDAVITEFGFSLTEFHELLGEAYSIGSKIHSSVASLPLIELISDLSKQLNWSKEKVSKILNSLLLYSRTNFLKPDFPFKPEDVYPWKYNRSLSYLRRPFLQYELDGQIRVIWGLRHLKNVADYLVHLCLNGKLKAKGPKMKNLISDIRNQDGEDFNDKVADLLEKEQSFIVRRRVKKINKIKITVGDIDVLVADPKKRILTIIECKNLNLSRTPHEMANELRSLFQESEGKKSAVAHHQERVDWICSQIFQVLTWLKLDSISNWNVKPLIVTDYELPTPHLWSSPIPVISFLELSKHLSSTHSI